MVRDANEDPEFIQRFVYKLTIYRKPEFTTARFLSAIMIGYLWSQLMMIAIPSQIVLGIEWGFLHWLIPLAGALGNIIISYTKMYQFWLFATKYNTIFRHMDRGKYGPWERMHRSLSLSCIYCISSTILCIRWNVLDDNNVGSIGDCIWDVFETMASRTTETTFIEKAYCIFVNSRPYLPVIMGLILLFQWKNHGYGWWWGASVGSNTQFPGITMVDRFKINVEWHMAICTA